VGSDEILEVKHHYEELPYPPRDANFDESSSDVMHYSLRTLSHFLWQGRNISKSLRILVAGGGTGDETVALSKNVLGFQGSEVVHLDLSSTSIEIARKRIEKIGTSAIVHFIQGSILDIPQLNIGTFDFIACSGVLHHMPDPAAGLDALTSVLRPTGGMVLMVYGTHGRHGIDIVRSLFKHLFPDAVGLPRGKQVSLLRQLMGSLPPWHAMLRNPTLTQVHMHRAHTHSTHTAQTKHTYTSLL
jgi:ubiquinone/menaquinone biosynthesis C-methylase UbiE